MELEQRRSRDARVRAARTASIDLVERYCFEAVVILRRR
jgi:hypothetical protein